jgi:uncharacterized membrane protein YbaN (DUF454 family)
VLPTTVFWIGAVWCWSRSAPHLTRRILAHPRFGQPVHLFIERGQLTKQGKWLALGGMVTSYTLLLAVGRPQWPLSLLIGLTLSLIAIWLWLRPEPPRLPLSGTEGLTYAESTETAASTDLQQGNS